MDSATVARRQSEIQHWADELAPTSVAEVFQRLVTSFDGLSQSEAAIRLELFGANKLPEARHKSWLVVFASNFVHLFALLLWTAGIIAFFAGMPELAVGIILVVVVNGVFSYWQQYRAQQAVRGLESLLPRWVTVRRSQTSIVIDATQVAIGDLLVLREGNLIPADARVVRANRLRVDTSALTGESRPTTRNSEPDRVANKTAAGFTNIVLAGTTVVSGHAEAVVFATGEHTQFGHLASLTFGQVDQASPLEREIRRMTRMITVLAMILGLVFFGIGASVGGLTVTEGFLFALGIIVANVPEGLLPTMSLALALGVRRMAGRKAIVKQLERVETLGAVTVIVTDKTGTLTKNQMTVRNVWCSAGECEVSGTGYDVQGQLNPSDSQTGTSKDTLETLQVATLCCETQSLSVGVGGSHSLSDPTETAILVAAKKAELGDDLWRANPRVGELPFDSIRKRMTSIHQTQDGQIACIKGALSHVLPRCTSLLHNQLVQPLDDERRGRIEEASRRFSEKGLRVLAVAKHPLPISATAWTDNQIEQELTFLGLIGMEDPPRDEVRGAICDCHTAGIRIIMATGDDGWTAAAIGREIGLCREGTRVITGSEMEAMSDLSLAMELGKPEIIFSRVDPIHKLRIVELLQKRGEVVAVTGDGVNDAPALKRADIGVAMGASGTDVAREAADIVLLDDNFATIVAAIEEGRGVYDNIRKFVTYIFASNVPEVVPFIVFVIFRIPLPLTVMQILAVDLGTDLLPALALGTERPESDVMRRPPRRRDQRMLDQPTLLRAYAWLGMIEAALGLLGFFFVYWWAGWRPGESLPASGPIYVAATTMSLAGIVACQIGNAFACRSQRESVFTQGLFSNRALLLAIAAELGLLLILIHYPPLADLFHLSQLSAAHWLLLSAFGPALLLAEEVRKAIVRQTRNNARANPEFE